MKFSRGFAEASLELILGQALPLADVFTGGKASAAGADVSAKAGAVGDALKEASDLFYAIQKALTDGATSAEISALFKEAREAKEALAAIKKAGSAAKKADKEAAV